MGGPLFVGRGRLTSTTHWHKAIELIGEANTAGARLVSACSEIGICLRTLKCWRKAFGGDGDGKDRRSGSARLVEALPERGELPANPAHLQPAAVRLSAAGQIVPVLADQKLFIGSESSFCRVLH